MPWEYDYAEGGGRLPPYQESFLENIVNVSWSGATGGVFVSGDFCCYQRYTRLEDNKSDEFRWVGLGSGGFGDGGGTESSSYGKTANGPVFVLGGHRGGSNPAAVWMRSTDGYNWVTTLVYAPWDRVASLVWDANEKRFYAANSDGITVYSVDGFTWVNSATDIEAHYRGIIAAPDGIYGYDKSHDLLIYPDGGQAFAVVNASQTDAEEFTISVGLDDVFAINFTGGIWMAGGGIEGSATTTSLDGGGFWFVSSFGDLDMTGNYAVTTLIGAPIQDFVGRNAQKNPPSVKPSTGTATPTLGVQNASRLQRPQRGVMAAAISPPRRPRVRLRRPYRPI